MKNISEWLRRAYDKVRKQVPKPFRGASYAAAPHGARVKNPLSDRANFAHCILRRTGYAAHVATADLAALNYKPLSKSRQEWMQHAWSKGVTWSPVFVEAQIENDRFVVNHILNYDICVFLSGRQRMMVVQVAEPDRGPGSEEKLKILKRGIYLRDGTRCPIVYARVVL